uniref:Uncharacterized protein n=1 Tax=Oryza punctata TaxID=4537 RepID=A0A0E0L3G8_ORYPU
MNTEILNYQTLVAELVGTIRRQQNASQLIAPACACEMRRVDAMGIFWDATLRGLELGLHLVGLDLFNSPNGPFTKAQYERPNFGGPLVWPIHVAGSLRHGDGARRGDPHGGVVLRHGFPPAEAAAFAGHIKDDDDDVPLPSRMEAEDASRLAALVSHTIAACRTAKRRPLPTRFLPGNAAAALA